MSRSASQLVRCRLCGHEFDPAALACHAGCPLGPRCSLVCCPNCGYQVVDESRTLVARVLGRLMRTGDERNDPTPRPQAGSVPLTHVPDQTDVEIASLRAMPASRSARLSAFGLSPGSRVRVVQRRPVPIIRIGETELAVSEEILDQIWVEPPERAA